MKTFSAKGLILLAQGVYSELTTPGKKQRLLLQGQCERRKFEGLSSLCSQEAFPTASSLSPRLLDMMERKPGRFKRATCWEVTG